MGATKEIATLRSEVQMLKSRVEEIESVLGTEGAMIGVQAGLRVDTYPRAKAEIMALYRLVKTTYQFSHTSEEDELDA